MFPNIVIYSNLCLSLQSDALSPHCHSHCHVAESFRLGVYTPGTRQEDLQEVTRLRPNKWIFKFKSEFRCVVGLATWCYCPNFGWGLCELHHCCSFLPFPAWKQSRDWWTSGSWVPGGSCVCCLMLGTRVAKAVYYSKWLVVWKMFYCSIYWE